MTEKSLIVIKVRRHPLRKRWFLLRPIARLVVRVLRTTPILAFVLFLVVPVDESPASVKVKTRRAEEILEELRSGLSIDHKVQIVTVTSDPFVFSIKRDIAQKDTYLLSMEIGFLLQLTEDELRAALAHELGHVWIFTHFPYLHTERLANDIGRRLVRRGSFEKLYSKLWRYEGTRGVPLEQLLGEETDSIPVMTGAGGR